MSVDIMILIAIDTTQREKTASKLKAITVRSKS